MFAIVSQNLLARRQLKRLGSGGRGGGTVSEARVPIVIPETSLACLSTNSVRYVQVCCRLGNIERYIIQSLGIGSILLYKHRIQLNYFLALQEIRQNCNSMQPYHKCFPFLLRYRVKCLPKIYSISRKELVPTQTSTLNGFPLYNSLLLTLTLFPPVSLQYTRCPIWRYYPCPAAVKSRTTASNWLRRTYRSWGHWTCPGVLALRTLRSNTLPVI